MSRLEQTFRSCKAKGRTGLITGVTVGFPTVEATLEIVHAFIQGGADVIELCVPFSDPLADGATIQRSSQVALEQGVTLRACLDVCRQVRERHQQVPLVFMCYYNPILAYGLEAFAADARASGADGVIVPDLPPEEAGDLRKACLSHGIDLVFLLAPTSTEQRIKLVAAAASGFVYCVSLTGVTGSRSQLPEDLPEFLARVRRHTDLPIAVGFGISAAEHVRTVGSVADAVIIASALVAAIERGGKAAAQDFVRGLSAGTVKDNGAKGSSRGRLP